MPSKYQKYPKTYHLPWSPGVSNDDKVQTDLSTLQDKEIVVSIKMDGECTSLYRDYIHARSLEFKTHPSRTWVQNFHAAIRKDIPEGYRICGENLFAKHSIHYTNLRSYFYVYSIWNEETCLGVDETLEWCNLLDLEHIDIIYRGIFNKDTIRSIKLDELQQEGYVVRPVKSFNIKDFKNVVLKYVRANHVQTNEHWLNSSIIKNVLK